MDIINQSHQPPTTHPAGEAVVNVTRCVDFIRSGVDFGIQLGVIIGAIASAFTIVLHLGAWIYCLRLLLAAKSK